MKDIIIVGAGGFGRELYHMIRLINNIKPIWNIKGFINDIDVDLKLKKIESPILGKIADWEPSNNEVFALGISSPQGKEKVVKILESKGAEFVSIIHPRANIVNTSSIGRGCVVGPTSSIGDCASVGNFVHVVGSCVGQDATIGDFSTTTAFVNIAGGRIGKRVFIGSHSVILGKTVGDDAFVCAGSIVLTNVKPSTRVMGYPAKKMDF